MAARCCRCASTGRCVRCSCARSGRTCSDCVPSTKGFCSNQSGNSSSSDGPCPDASASVNVGLDHVVHPPDETPSASVLSSDPPLESPLESPLSIQHVYDEVVHWSVDCMEIPLGNCGKELVSILSDLFRDFADHPEESNSLLLALTLPKLLLQRPSPAVRGDKTNRNILERRLVSWKDGNFLSLLEEGRVIQKYQRRRFGAGPYGGRKNGDSLSKSFAGLMSKGKLGAALDLVTNREKGGVLKPEDVVDGKSVKFILLDKHPKKQPVNVDVLLSSVDGNLSGSYSVLFEAIDASAIRRAVLNTSCAAGLSGLDAYAWRRLCTSHGKTFDGLCHSLASLARNLCTVEFNPKSLVPLLACRLINR